MTSAITRPWTEQGYGTEGLAAAEPLQWLPRGRPHLLWR